MKLTPQLALAAFSWLSVASPLAAQQSQALTPESLQRSSWYSDVSQRLERAEYGFSASSGGDGGFSAPNRAQGFQSRVTSGGLEVLPRANADGDTCAQWKFSLSTKSFGREGYALELAAAEMQLASDRVELDHGAISEWFVNDEHGLEQGWTIAAAPSGDGRLWIGLQFGGDLSLRIDSSERAGLLVDARGDVRLRYSSLAAFDATGRELDARITSSPNGVGISIDDTRAVYPLTVDPMLTGPAWTAESNQDNSSMGFSVASAGDVNGDGYSDVLVGAVYYSNGEGFEGRAYLYVGGAAGLASSPAWTAEGNQFFSYFASVLGTAGDVNADGYSDVIVGAALYDNQGAAFLYMGSSAGLSATPAATLEAGQANAQFGASVGTAGDVNGDGYSDVVIGASAFSNGESQEGRAFIYLGSSGGLNTTAAWTAESNATDARFGLSVSTAGDVNRDGFDDVIIGAPRYTSTFINAGRAYLYLGSAAGVAASPVWSLVGDQLEGWLGTSVATAGDVNGDGYSDVIVGVPRYDNGQSDEGACFVFIGSSSGLIPLATWAAEGNQVNAQFASSVGTAGDVNGDGYSDVIVGAWYYDSGQGRALVYLGSSTGLATSAAWSANSGQANAYFGWAVAAAGDTNRDGYSDVIVGATGFDNGQSEEGRAFVYFGAGVGLATSPASTLTFVDPYARPFFIADAGDVNGDGYSDVIMQVEPNVLVYSGSSTGLSTSPAWSAALNAGTVASAGDVNGDGYGDVIVSVAGLGQARVYLGSSAGLATSAAWTTSISGDLWVASAGDVNGDGYGDVIIGQPSYDTVSMIGVGRALVFHGSATGLASTPAWTVVGVQDFEGLGEAVATAGDVNADGYSDVIIGAPLYGSFPNNYEGRAMLYLGSSSGLATNAAWTKIGGAGAQFGVSVATAGDVNGDGRSDVIIGANGASAAYVYDGTSAGLTTNPAWTASSGYWANFGCSVASAGDVNGDGYCDVIVGASQYDATIFNGTTNEGRAFVYHGSATGLSPSAAWTVDGEQPNAWLGLPVSPAGDVNGDGFSDVLVLATWYGDTVPPNLGPGHMYLYLGNGGRGGWTRAPQQRHSDNSAPIDLLGRSVDFLRFRIGLDFEHSFAGFDWASGRTPKARLQWEVKPLRTPLDETSTESGLEQSITGLPMSFDEIAAFPGGFGTRQLTASGPYHWRARLRTNNPLFPVTPWVTIPRNNVTETKLRVLPHIPGLDVPH